MADPHYALTANVAEQLPVATATRPGTSGLERPALDQRFHTAPRRNRLLFRPPFPPSFCSAPFPAPFCHHPPVTRSSTPRTASHPPPCRLPSALPALRQPTTTAHHLMYFSWCVGVVGCRSAFPDRFCKGHGGGWLVRVWFRSEFRAFVRPRSRPEVLSRRPTCSNSAAPGGSQGRFAPDPRRGLTTAWRGASIAGRSARWVAGDGQRDHAGLSEAHPTVCAEDERTFSYV